MHPKRRRRLVLICLLLIGLGTGAALVLYGLRSNINLFYTPSQISEGQASVGQFVRVGGLVKPNSVHYQSTQQVQVQFTLTDNQHDLVIHFHGLLPDLFREGQGIVEEGILQADRTLRAKRVLAKHDARYMPPEVAAALKKAHQTAIRSGQAMPSNHHPLPPTPATSLPQ